MSPDRTHRLWRKHGLQVPRHRPRRRISTGRPRPLLPERVNHAVVDEYNRDCLAIDVDGSIRSGRVIEVLAKLRRSGVL